MLRCGCAGAWADEPRRRLTPQRYPNLDVSLGGGRDPNDLFRGATPPAASGRERRLLWLPELTALRLKAEIQTEA
jgi:hypothetical protein